MAKAIAAADNEKEINSLKARIDSLTAHLDKAYMNNLSNVLDEADFQRIYAKINADRAALERWLSQLDRPDYSPAEQMDLAKKLTERFLENASANREPLVSLIEHVKLTANKQIIIKFQFKQLETDSNRRKITNCIVYNTRGALYRAAAIVNKAAGCAPSGSLQRFSHNNPAVPFGALGKAAFFIHRQMPPIVFVRFCDLPLGIGLDKVKTLVGRVFADALQQLCGDPLALPLWRDHKAEDGFDLDAIGVLGYGPKRAQVV